jgi:hypothetical protein
MTLKLRLGLGLGSGRLWFTLYFTRTTSCIYPKPTCGACQHPLLHAAATCIPEQRHVMWGLRALYH